MHSPLGKLFEDRGVRGGALADLHGRVPEFEVPDVLLHRGSAAVSWGQREAASVRERKEILPKLWQILSCLCATMPEESAETEASLQRHARIWLLSRWRSRRPSETWWAKRRGRDKGGSWAFCAATKKKPNGKSPTTPKKKKPNAKAASPASAVSGDWLQDFEIPPIQEEEEEDDELLASVKGLSQCHPRRLSLLRDLLQPCWRSQPPRSKSKKILKKLPDDF